MIGGAAAAVAVCSRASPMRSPEVENHRKYRVRDDDHKDAGDDGGCRHAPDAFGPAAYAKAIEAADTGDEHCKGNALHQSGTDVPHTGRDPQLADIHLHR